MGEPVGPSTGSFAHATTQPFQRKSFYAAGWFWVFYGDGTNMVYRTSRDGVNWASPTIIRTCNIGGYFSIWFDETYMHYAYSSGVGFTPLYYRRGIPELDGSITWSAAEQTAVAGVANIGYWYPFVSVDSDGHAWIGYRRLDRTGPYPWIENPSVTRSQLTNGTWGVTPGGFPHSFPSFAYNITLISVIPLTANNMLAVYIYTGDKKVRATLWDGAAWGIEASTSRKIRGTYFSAVAEGDDVHLVFKDSSSRLVYAKYDYSSNSFIKEKSLLTGLAGYSAPVISMDKNNNLSVFWSGSPQTNTLYYMIYTTETDTWGPAVKWKTEENLYGGSLTCFYKQYSGYTGLAYTRGKSGSYAVMFNYIASQETSDPTPEPEVVSHILTASGSRHTTPEQGSVGTSLRTKRGRLVRHITWVPVVIVRA